MMSGTFDRQEQRCLAERPIRIACIGAGIAGLCFAYKLQRSFKNFSLAIFDKNSDIGGVWFENTYPGLTCDIPIHNYTYSWEPAPKIGRELATGPEIRQYLKDFADKHDLLRHVKFSTKVIGAEWNDSTATWALETESALDGRTELHTVDILINAGGTLNNWKLPAIPGLHDFQGTLVHTANWKDDVDTRGKKVAVIGNGASGQQVLTALQPDTAHLVHVIRQPNWPIGPFADPPRTFGEEDLARFADPAILTAKRKKTESGINSTFGIFLKASPLQQGARAMATQGLQDHLDSLGLPHSLIPNFALGCRRPTPGIGYIEALGAPNVEVSIGGVRQVTPTGLIDEAGKEHSVEVIVCATGFDTSYKPRFPILGDKGINLQDVWHLDVADSYLATAAPGFPNFMFFLGPFNTGTSGSHTRAIEIQTDYMLQMIDRYQTENIKSFAPKLEAARDFTTYARGFLKRTVFTDACRSHFKAGTSDEHTLSLWPGSCLHFSDVMRELRADDWDIVYDGNRFAWLGNGLSATGADPTSDIAWYITDKDEGHFSSRRARREILTKHGSCPQRETELAPQGKTAD